MYEFRQDISELVEKINGDGSNPTIETILNFNELLRFLLNASGRPVYAWGASKFTKELIESRLFSGVFVGVIDRNESLTGSVYSGLPVVSMETLHTEEKPVILIASNWFNDIKQHLEQEGYCDGVDFINVIALYKGLSWMFNFCDLKDVEIQKVNPGNLLRG